MMSVFYQIQSILLTVILLISSLFSLGGMPKTVTMPDLGAGQYGQYVNPFIGTGGVPWMGGNLSPAASSPFGAIKLGPDTVPLTGKAISGNWATAGYAYSDTGILGFSHTRLSGTGIRDMGQHRVTPAIGDTDPAGRRDNPLLFSHDDEEATAGYYAVYLPTIDCMAEMTALEHVGAHRYTFGSSKDAHLFLDVTSCLTDGGTDEGQVIYDPNTGLITGWGRVNTGFSGRYGGLTTYFAATVDMPVQSHSMWLDGVSTDGLTDVTGKDCGINLNFGDVTGQPITMKLAISFVSIDNAKENLTAEAGDLDFEGVRAAARDKWEQRLSSMAIESADTTILTNFYTALYHSMIMPSTYTDVNGEYLGFNQTVGVADGYTYLSDLSLWDTFRNTHPLYALIAPDIQRDSLKSLMEMANIGGVLPRWPSGGGYTGSMFGTPADMVFAESYLKGFTEFDVEAAYAYMKKTSEQAVDKDGRNAVDAYNTLGYVPADVAGKSVSLTLEYAWADNSISLLAAALGKDDEAAYYKEKSMRYLNLFDTETGYFRGKNADGTWVENFDPNVTSFYDDIIGTDSADPYCEGSAQHWRWCVVQDVPGLINLLGGADSFCSELEKFMEGASAEKGAIDPGAGYWIGNEHDLQTPYLFGDAGKPELTQKWVRWTLSTRFGTDSEGLDGNDDGGALSSWYVWSAVGLYPQAGSDLYWIGSPNVDKATLNLGNDKTLTVVAENQSADNVYVQEITLNGEPLTSAALKHSQIADGGTLIFTMGSTPAANGGF